MPLQTSFDIMDKEECKKTLVDTLLESSNPKKNARNLKDFVAESSQEVRDSYTDLFKHQLLSNFKDLMSGQMKEFDAGDIIILADKVEAEEKVEGQIYDLVKIELQ